MNLENSSILLDQFIRIMKLAPQSMVISCISKEVYIFSHKPTEVSFYVAGETEEDEHKYAINFFHGGQTTPLAKIGPESPIYEILSTHLALHNLNDLLEAQFRMDEYLQKVDTRA